MRKGLRLALVDEKKDKIRETENDDYPAAVDLLQGEPRAHGNLLLHSRHMDCTHTPRRGLIACAFADRGELLVQASRSGVERT